MKNDIRERTLFDYPRELRGFPQNRWGGYRTIRIQTYPPLLPFGSADPCRTYTDEERRALERKMRAEGRLGPSPRRRRGR